MLHVAFCRIPDVLCHRLGGDERRRLPDHSVGWEASPREWVAGTELDDHFVGNRAGGEHVDSGMLFLLR